MTSETDRNETWLAITEAAQQLGVHVTTLRRWADDGEIPVMLTPGGHRRFSSLEIENFRRDRYRIKGLYGFEQLWAEAALSHTRAEILSHNDMRWLSSFDELERERNRQMGRRMMGLLLQFVSLGKGGEEILEESRAMGREHAKSVIMLGLPSREALRATMFFRDSVMEAAMDLPDTMNIRPEVNTRLLLRVNEIFNAFLLAVAETYDQVVRA